LGGIAIQTIQEKIDISVYFKSNAQEDAVLNLKRSLEGLSEVKAVDYISRDEALEDFRNRHAGDEVITQTLDELEENPLLASLNIKAEDPRKYETIANYLDQPALKDMIEKVTFAQNQAVIDRLNNLVETSQRSGLILTLFLAFLAAIVTFNTIRLAIFSASEQISIMRLVGASNSFIRGPYIVEGIIYGVIAAVASFVIVIPIIQWASPHVSGFIPEADLSSYFSQEFLALLFYQILFGVVLGIISSAIAVSRYLKV
jgi:cell division transport system permease protein